MTRDTDTTGERTVTSTELTLAGLGLAVVAITLFAVVGAASSVPLAPDVADHNETATVQTAASAGDVPATSANTVPRQELPSGTSSAAVAGIVGGILVTLPALLIIEAILIVGGGREIMSLAVGGLLVAAGVFVLLRPEYATKIGLGASVLAVTSLLSSFGGYFAGALFASAGAVLCFAWESGEKIEETVADDGEPASGDDEASDET